MSPKEWLYNPPVYGWGLCLLFLLLFSLTGCEELDLILSARTPSFVEGVPKILVCDNAVSNCESTLLAAQGWRKARLFEELPERVAFQTGSGDRIQLLLRGRGVLEIRPESLVVLSGEGMSGVSVIQGKAVFINVPEYFRSRYRAAVQSQEKLALVEAFRKKYLEEREGMLYVRNPFRFATVFSSSVAKKGKTFSVVVDTNHDLAYSRFQLAGLHPSFHRIRTKKDFGESFRYMAVTGLGIYERVQNIEYSAEARDLTGNWVKVKSTIPTENYRFRLLRGRRLSPATLVSADRKKYKKRFRKQLAKKLTTKRARRRYYARLRRRNRRLGFYWKWRGIFRQGRAIRRANKFFSKLLHKATAKKHWRGRFRIPVGGVVTSEYGHYRYYYGGRASRHLAIDIAAPVGTPLGAPNGGCVAYTGYTPTRGANIVIDHGLGVYSCLFHMSEIYVRKGDLVKTGDIVGTMGNSGLSSGPHLHWEMWVNGRKVNPLDWVKNSY